MLLIMHVHQEPVFVFHLPVAAECQQTCDHVLGEYRLVGTIKPGIDTAVTGGKFESFQRFFMLLVLLVQLAQSYQLPNERGCIGTFILAGSCDALQQGANCTDSGFVRLACRTDAEYCRRIAIGSDGQSGCKRHRVEHQPPQIHCRLCTIEGHDQQIAEGNSDYDEYGSKRLAADFTHPHATPP